MGSARLEGGSWNSSSAQPSKGREICSHSEEEMGEEMLPTSGNFRRSQSVSLAWHAQALGFSGSCVRVRGAGKLPTTPSLPTLNRVTVIFPFGCDRVRAGAVIRLGAVK